MYGSVHVGIDYFSEIMPQIQCKCKNSIVGIFLVNNEPKNHFNQLTATDFKLQKRFPFVQIFYNDK